MEKAMCVPGITANVILNHDITTEEVKRAISNALPNKASEILGIPNEALKSPHLLEVLFQFVKIHFENV